MRSDAKNLAALDAALRQHAATCEAPPVAIRMAPFEVERLGWDDYQGIPIETDPEMQTGRFLIVCNGEETELAEETVEAVTRERELELA